MSDVGAARMGAARFLIDEATYTLRLEQAIDVAKERARLAKDHARLSNDIDRLAKKLNNPDFVAKAPEEVVEEERERYQEAMAARAKLGEILDRLPRG